MNISVDIQLDCEDGETELTEKTASMTSPLRPKDGSWVEEGKCQHTGAIMWKNVFNIVALSAVEVVQGKEQYHLSFSESGRRISNGLMEAILRQWGAEKFEEDNHVPNGKVRNYWWIIGETLQICPCVAVEEPHVEEGGYVWREDSQK